MFRRRHRARARSVLTWPRAGAHGQIIQLPAHANTQPACSDGGEMRASQRTDARRAFDERKFKDFALRGARRPHSSFNVVKTISRGRRRPTLQVVALQRATRGGRCWMVAKKKPARPLTHQLLFACRRLIRNFIDSMATENSISE